MLPVIPDNALLVNIRRSYVTFNVWKAKTKLRGFGPRANYADRATAACWRKQCKLLRIDSVAWSAQRIATVVNLGFLNQSTESSRSLILLQLIAEGAIGM
jgi:hypothetical protein